MKVQPPIIATLLLLASFTSFAQTEQDLIAVRQKIEKDKQNRIAEKKAIADFPEVGYLRKSLHASTTPQTCLQVLDPYLQKGETRIVPYLKAHLEQYRVCNDEIQVALVKLGEDEYYQRILLEIRSDEPSFRVRAIRKLAQIKSKESYRKLYELLDDTSGSKQGSDYVIAPLNHYVMESLLQTVEDPPTGSKRYDPEVWKAWFEKNRHLIE